MFLQNLVVRGIFKFKKSTNLLINYNNYGAQAPVFFLNYVSCKIYLSILDLKQRLNDEIKKRKAQEKTARIKRIISDLENEKITRL